MKTKDIINLFITMFFVMLGSYLGTFIIPSSHVMSSESIITLAGIITIIGVIRDDPRRSDNHSGDTST